MGERVPVLTNETMPIRTAAHVNTKTDMSNTQSTHQIPSCQSLRLVVPQVGDTATDIPSFQIGNHRWILIDRDQYEMENSDLEYVCVSYACGDGVASNPLDHGKEISDRTLSVLSVSVLNECPPALWIDSFCIPSTEPGKTACLMQMGMIFSQAARVVVVLSKRCFDVLARISKSSELNESSIAILEADDWVSRAWTYQELVNNSNIRFVAEGFSGTSVGAGDMLYCVACAIDDFKKERGIDSFEFRSLYPRVSSLEDLIVDWRISDYTDRTAYQVMSSMHGRDSRVAGDYTYAMVGAISADHIIDMDQVALRPTDYLMNVCETKGDYSFIYTAAARSQVPGRCWKPKAEDRLRAILPWHNWGEGQSASVFPTHINLKEMWTVTPGTLGGSAKEFLIKWLSKENQDCSRNDLPALLFRKLRLAGFPESAMGTKVDRGYDCIETEHGYMFLSSMLDDLNDVIGVVATGIRMAFGSPCFLLKSRHSDIHKFCSVGFFMGRVPKSGETVSIC